MYLDHEYISQVENGVPGWARVRNMYIEHEYDIHGREWCT